jgi:glucosamine--fructose-6-phosphate aminotransferase (isomerizing)
MRPESALYSSILSQPELIHDTLERCEPEARRAAEIVARARRVFLAGTGTNSHAAVVGEHLLRSVGVDAWATTHFDFVTYPRPLSADDAVIALSHTATTQYGNRTIARAREAGCPVVGITGQDSGMEGPDIVLAVSPKERSDTYTVSYTATLAVLALIAVRAGEQRGADTSDLATALLEVSAHVADLLDRYQEQIASEAELGTQAGRIVLVGAGPNAVTAREGALKTKESSYLVAEGFELETFLHGGLQAVDAGNLGIVIAAYGRALARTKDVARALNTVGAHPLIVADERAVDGLPDLGDTQVIAFHPVPEPLSPLLAVIPLQLLAAFMAELRGTNPDNFRFDEERYKRAIEGLTL